MKRFIQVQNVISFSSAILEPLIHIFLVIYFQFKFVISIFKNPQLQNARAHHEFFKGIFKHHKSISAQ